MNRRQFIGASTILTGLGSASIPYAHAQAPNARKFVVPGSAGTGGDTMARYMARSLEKSLEIPIVVDNKPGAGGIIGTDFVAKSLPDGNTFLVTTANHYALPWIYEKMPYKAQEDFVPVAGFGSSTLLMVVSPDSPYFTVQDIIKDARNGNTSLSYSSAGSGTLSHIAGALLNTMADLKMRHVPYKSASQGLLDVSTGVVTIGFLGVAGALPLVHGGKLKIIAVTGKNRSIHFPRIPAIREAGFDGYDIESPFFAWVPKGTPSSIIEKMEKGFIAATHEPSYQDFCKSQGFETEYRETAAQLAASAPKDFLKWKNLISIAEARST
ncbi:tripartite tricarboxylate transporter substrate binding protein [Pseudorhodoferax sp.]|uniref:tripartite tricarboxylate transporter substrate binding protein n=1 Tax=Pseudorhodoferax sp. TaxID=1993553 RepID=UPI0039E39EDA